MPAQKAKSINAMSTEVFFNEQNGQLTITIRLAITCVRVGITLAFYAQYWYRFSISQI